LGLPLSRSSYLLGRFSANALFLGICSGVLCLVAFGVIFYVSTIYPPARPVQWLTIGVAVCFDTLKYILLIAVAFLFSTVSTSFFLPIFGAIALLMAGTASQGVYDYLHSAALSKNIPQALVEAANALYYLLPNFSSFDFKLQAVYGLPLSGQGLLLTAGYFAVYLAVVLTAAVMVFSRREMK
jgi:Cu-processing system permease protein